MSEKRSKFQALQIALEDYFSRYPRVTIKALSIRTSVPYATLRRIINSEVNDIKDETIFRVINRVMQRKDQIEFIRKYYPILENMNPVQPQIETSSDDFTRSFKRFLRMSPHNLVVKLALAKAFTSRRDVERLTGEYGLTALDEMIGAGLLVEEHDGIFVHSELESVSDVEDICHQIIKDIEYIPVTRKSGSSMVRHVFGSISPEGLTRIIDMGQNLVSEVNDLAQKDNGGIPFFFDLVSGTYDGT
ncbi:MAG: hypothetical protein M3Q07_18735 [Pseudobdellovibrionaceae bacterium]|nr:hypothetical protein [Pseudobdellovibrionaceae bacterium]